MHCIFLLTSKLRQAQQFYSPPRCRTRIFCCLDRRKELNSTHRKMCRLLRRAKGFPISEIFLIVVLNCIQPPHLVGYVKASANYSSGFLFWKYFRKGKTAKDTKYV